MTDEKPKTDSSPRLRQAVNRDGLLDLFGGMSMVLGVGLAVMGWQLMRNPGVFTAIGPMLLVLWFEPTRRRQTYPRLGCPDYEPEKEKRFATVALAVLAMLGVVVFLLASLGGPRVMGTLFEYAPIWAGLAGTGTMVLLAWWYRAYRFLGYIAVAAAAFVSGYLLDVHMLVRLGILAGAVGLVMTVVGAVLFLRFLHAFPRVSGTGAAR